MAGTDGTADWEFINHSAFAARIRDKYLIGRLDMSGDQAIARRALTNEKVRVMAKGDEHTRKSVLSDSGKWKILNRVEKKRRDTRASSESRAEREWTMAQVSTHDREDDCWIIIDGLVYDVTAFMVRHPGGKKSLMSYAGKDATGMFKGVCGLDTLGPEHHKQLCVGKLVAAVSQDDSEKVAAPNEEAVGDNKASRL